MFCLQFVWREDELHYIQKIGKGIKLNYITSKNTLENVSGIQNVIIYVGTVLRPFFQVSLTNLKSVQSYRRDPKDLGISGAVPRLDFSVPVGPFLSFPEHLVQPIFSLKVGRKQPSRDVIFSGQNLAQKCRKMVTSHDVLEPLKQVLSASRDLITSSQICSSNPGKFSH